MSVSDRLDAWRAAQLITQIARAIQQHEMTLPKSFEASSMSRADQIKHLDAAASLIWGLAGFEWPAKREAGGDE